MAGTFMGKETQERMDLGLTRALVLLIFTAHLTMALLAGIRRHRDSGVRRFLLWLACYVTEIGTPIALTMVYIDKVTMDIEQMFAYREQQMFAFWAPFLVLHLGRPDNITSYVWENKGLSSTQWSVLLEIGGAIYGSYKQRFMRGDGALCAAFFIMLFLGTYKCVERAVALRRASFANICRSSKRKIISQLSREDKGRKRDNDDALLDAHGLLGVTMGTFAEYQVNHYQYKPSYYAVEDVSKVVEMEASLMYDMLYTKASVIHTWGGYTIRVVSPFTTATALYLFHSKEGHAMESADQMVTYILLVGTLVLDVAWLLRALGSTWTYAFLVYIEQDKEEESKGLHHWLKKVSSLARRLAMQSWYLLRRFLVCLDPSRLSLRSGPSGHRLLPSSGVGQRNLLHECSTPPPPWGRLEKMNVKNQLLETYLEILDWSSLAMRVSLSEYMRSNAEKYSFERNLIALHIATDIFLLCKPRIESEESDDYEKRTRALSDYMMFLLAQRQHMVLTPGHEVIHYKKVCLDLEKIWQEKEIWPENEMWPRRGRRYNSAQTTREAKLANILLKMKNTSGSNYETSLLRDRNDTLALGAEWAINLLFQLEPLTYDSAYKEFKFIRRIDDFLPVSHPSVQEEIRECSDDEELDIYMLRLILSSWLRLFSALRQINAARNPMPSSSAAAVSS